MQQMEKRGGFDAPPTLDQYRPLLIKYAKKFQARSIGLGLGGDLEDLEQDLAIILLRCFDSYRPDAGSTFLNYAISAFYYEMNNRFRKAQANREVGITISCEEETSDGEVMNLLETLDSGWATPEQAVEAMMTLNEALESLSRPARVLVEILLDPPEIVLEQFELAQNGMKERRSAGETAKGYSSFNLRFLFNLFHIPKPAARALRQEIEQKVGAAFCVTV